MDKRLSVLVVLYGVLVIAGGIIGFTKGSVLSLATAGPLGVLTVVFGVFLLRGARWAARAAFFSCAAVAAVMIERLVATGKIVPAVPVAALGLGLAFLLLRTADATK